MSNKAIKNSIAYPPVLLEDQDRDPIRNLFLMDTLKEAFSDLNLEKTLVISVQHLCSTTGILFEALFQLHLDPQNLYVIGKCYSTNPEVLVRLRKKNVNALLSSSYFNASTPFDLDFDYKIDQMLQQIISSNDLYSYERIIILDDGGHLLEKASTLLSEDLPLIGIEQTSSGFNRLKEKNFSFPIINLARSWLKLEYESPIIIDLVIRKLTEKISKLRFDITQILIIGNGILGQKIHEVLKTKYLVSVFDCVPEKSMISSSMLRDRLSEFDLIIGCTGSTSLPFEDFTFLKKPVVLASISSSDREFEAFKFRKLNPKKNCHSNVTVDGITLLNSGFPITFDEDYDAIDTDDFQLTRALILASIYQASFTDLDLKGFLPMEDHLQKMILHELNNLSTGG